MLSIPLSLAIGLTLLHFAGFTVNQLSIVGAVVALGLLVDDSIVVVENITRFLRAGRTRVEAAIEATRQIAVAVVGATATLVLAFVPLLFLPGGPGQYIRSLPAAVIATVLASLFVSLTIIPWLASLVLAGARRRAATGRSTPSSARSTPPTPRCSTGRFAVRRGRSLAAGAFVAVALALVPAIGFSLFPKAETPQFYVNVTAPEGGSIEATAAAARYADSVIRRRPEVRAVFASVGRDNPRIYYNVAAPAGQPRGGPALRGAGALRPGAHPGAARQPPGRARGVSRRADRAARVRERPADRRADRDPGPRARPRHPARRSPRGWSGSSRPRRAPATWTTRCGSAAPTCGSPSTARRRGCSAFRRWRSTAPCGSASRASRRACSAKPTATPATWWCGSPALPGPIRPRSTGCTSPRSAGKLTPLRQVADVRFEADVPEIRRVDRERAVTVTSFVGTGYNTDRVTRQALATLDSLELPRGYRIVAGGRDREPAGELRRDRQRDHRGDVPDPRGAGARVPHLPRHPHRGVGDPARRGGRARSRSSSPATPSRSPR